MPSRSGVRAEIWINGDRDDRMHLEYCERSAGGMRLDYAVLSLDLSRRGRNAVLHNEEITGALGFECEIFATLAGRDTVLHWGIVEQLEPMIDDSGNETFKLISRVSPQRFGQALWGQRHFNPQPQAGGADRFPTLDEEIVFNPEIKGKVVPNMRTTPVGANGQRLFLSPDVGQTPAGAAYHESSTREEWTIAHAVNYLCQQANRDQEYIQNPTLADLQNFSQLNALGALRNLRIRNGIYLNQALDELLEPFGFSWQVALVGEGQRQIRVFRQGEGEAKQVWLQRPGSSLSGSAGDYNNLLKLDAVVSNDARINQVRSRGSRKIVEATFILVPAWPKDYDQLEPWGGELTQSWNEEWFEHPERHRVWRDWVLNEAGDYNGTHDYVTAPPDLSCLLQYSGSEYINPDTRQVLPRRRKFLPTLTQALDQQPIGNVHGIIVEYWDPRVGWIAIRPEADPTHSIKLLENECGIRFDGAEPPFEMFDVMQYGDRPQVRVTAAIELDSPLEVLADKQSAGHLAELDLDLTTRFHHRYYYDGSQGGDPQVKQSNFFRQVQAGSYGSSAVDDADEMFNFAAAVRDAWDLSDISGVLELEGLDQLIPYEIGDLVTKVSGREIGFPADDNRSRFPQIYAVSFNGQTQQTILTLNTFRQISAYVGNVIGDRRQRRARRELD